ncbi:PAS domain-containing sensor histidine kinase [Rhodoligotrophos defluvii]|uniref:PAS domain-containing sensor histidine kinase n=1 Tax=Rhodoligotrophos defluvii TaxID=2561934 RepID=UPI0010C97C4E|nr:PAS domain S-box protein [Rhodoligotrophos defluvii]
MSTVERLSRETHVLTEFEALVAAAPALLDAIPGAVYLCDTEGMLVRFNQEAVALWGREPRLGDPRERFCGACALFHPDGRRLPHAETPMARAIRTGEPARNLEVVVQRPDGSRITALVNIRALRDFNGRIQGAINCFQDISARKAMEQEIERGRQDLEDFFENSAIGLHIVGSDGTILRANRAELELLGYTAEEYVGRNITEFHADGPVIEDILQRLTCGGKLDRYPARLIAKDGSFKHVLITSNSRFIDGKFVNTRCFTTDVTDLHEAEVARRESEERLAATYNAATVGIAEIDETGRFLRVNPMLCRISGWSREELLERSFLDLTHPDDVEQDAALYSQQVRGEIDSYAIHKRYVRQNGEHIHVDVFSSSVRDENDRFRYGVRVVQDVTERRIANERLRQSERHTRELLEALPAAVYTTDAEGRITFYNQAAVELSGRTPKLGSDQWCVTWRLYTPDGVPLPHDQCPMAVSLREGRPIRGVEAVAERPDGTRVPFLPYPTPLLDADGKVVGAINMLVDISERKKAEMRQKVLIDELNHRVKNTLATVQALTRQTARHAAGTQDFVETLEARLMALSRAHDLLTRRHWQGANLADLLGEVIAPYVGLPNRLRIGGPPVDLSPRVAVAMTMACNELATNTAKYGALSRPGGILTVQWDVERSAKGAVLNLTWLEAGGPPVSPPARPGFGMRLLARCIEADLGGTVDLKFDPEGASCRIGVPLDQETATTMHD